MDPKWRQRGTRDHHNWGSQIEGLTDSYLHWNYPPPEGDSSKSTTDAAMHCDDSRYLPFEILVVDLYTFNSTCIVTPTNEQRQRVNEALVSAGYLGNSPEDPSIAISLMTLELYEVLRQRKASFSFEAFAKVAKDRSFIHQ